MADHRHGFVVYWLSVLLSFDSSLLGAEGRTRSQGSPPKSARCSALWPRVSPTAIARAWSSQWARSRTRGRCLFESLTFRRTTRNATAE